MRRLCLRLVFAVLVASVCACGSGGSERIRVSSGRLDVRAELAVTPEIRARGLSGRASLAQDEGMLFVFPTSSQPAFWMQGMQFPLDFIWISAGGRITDLTENVPPPAAATPDSELPVYRPSAPVLYVLEVNAGVVAATAVHMGDAIALDPPPPTKGVR